MGLLDLTIGAVEIGVLISSILYGVVGSQAFSYVDKSFKDASFLRSMVWLLCVTETVHTICIWAFLYSMTVTNYGNPASLFTVPWSLAGIVVVTTFTTCSVQSFLSYRIYVLSSRLLLPVIAWISIALHAILGFTLVGLLVNSKSLLYLNRHQWMVTTDLAMHAAVDVVNAGGMAYYLLRKRSTFKPTQRIVDKLVIYSLETGAITSLFSVSVLITSLTMETNFVYLAIFAIYPKLFSIVFLVSLTSRKDLRNNMGFGVDSGRVWSSNDHQHSETGVRSDVLHSMKLSNDVGDIETVQLSSSRTFDNSKRMPVSGVTVTTEFEMVTAKSHDQQSSDSQW